MEHKKVLVGMSGGVDSAAAALLLREAGYEPVGCTLRLYDNEDIGESAEGTCCSLEAVEDAREACRKLGMDHYTFNFSGQFRRQVMDEFVAAYQSGRTPNPCVQCNRAVKFEALARRADELDIPYIATGHYARADRQGNRWRLLRGADRRKDQSYFLYPLSQRLLCRLLLPVGPMTSPPSAPWRPPRVSPAPAGRTARTSASFPTGTISAFCSGTAGRSLSPAILWTRRAGYWGGTGACPAILRASGGVWESARTGRCMYCERTRPTTR